MNMPISGAFNDALIAEKYEEFRNDPTAVDESWRQYFRFAERLAGVTGSGQSGAASTESARAIAGAAMLVQSIRAHGHYDVALDPLGAPAFGAIELTPEFHGITASDLDNIPADALGFSWGKTASDVVGKLRQLYSSNMGFETEHMDEDVERVWFRTMIEEEKFARQLNAAEKRAMLERLSEVDGLERFLGRAYVGHKRFSIEGTDILVPMLDELIEASAMLDAGEVVISMAHRGRLNVLSHILGKPYEHLFAEFEGASQHVNTAGSSGDVKYHLGARGTRVMKDGRKVRIGLVPNPSHLEFVNPVLTGVARARQMAGSVAAVQDTRSVVPVCIHGDAAFPGEGIVAETFNLARLAGYQVGGTVHIIVNNQIGYTTNPGDARSTHYSSDVAKGFDVPVVHVSADDPEACIAAVRLAVAFRARFKQDFLIDVVGYRRHGHNEGDEPSYTQPKLYDKIKSHPTVRALWSGRLVTEGVLTGDEAGQIEGKAMARLESAHDALQKRESTSSVDPMRPTPAASQLLPEVGAGVDEAALVALNEALLTWPDNIQPNTRLAKQLEKRRELIHAEQGLDWGHAESLAFASLLVSGVNIRLSGQDAERGTFSHRHAVLHDKSGAGSYTPLQHVPGAQGRFEIHNSPLSETAVLGFEYGFSTASPGSLVLWEAQFGDFVNVAQPIMDQFLFSDRAKWGQDSSVVLLLPHGYEGQGPEHSSARLERFLQSCAEDNMRVAYPSTPAQYFHILRRQATQESRRPLVLMQPKSLLRKPEAASSLAALLSGSFQTVIDDSAHSSAGDSVRRIVFCTGKMYYDVAAALSELDSSRRAEIALVRIEELYPWPHEEVVALVDRYPSAEEMMWVQEEPRNMGAWSYALPRLHASAGNLAKVTYAGRAEQASPAEGLKSVHDAEQKRIVAQVLDLPQKSGNRRRTPAVAG